MAFRVLARRVPGPQVQSVLRFQRRGLADEYTGKAIDEKEKAAETRYIRKMEEEQEQRRKAGIPKTRESATVSVPEGATKEEYPGPTSEGGFRNTAIVAGLIAVVAGYWLLSGSSKKEEKESA